MNRHFEDARYYLKRAGEHAAEGVKEELKPVEERLRELAGREAEPEPTRLDRIRDELTEMERRAEGEAKSAIGDARGRLRTYREAEPEATEA
jgi:hypothetical protein